MNDTFSYMQDAGMETSDQTMVDDCVQDMVEHEIDWDGLFDHDPICPQPQSPLQCEGNLDAGTDDAPLKVNNPNVLAETPQPAAGKPINNSQPRNLFIPKQVQRKANSVATNLKNPFKPSAAAKLAMQHCLTYGRHDRRCAAR